MSAGYALTCREMFLVVERELRARVHNQPNIQRQYNQKNVFETFASDHTFQRYNTDNLNSLGQNRHVQSITCRSLLTDKVS